MKQIIASLLLCVVLAAGSCNGESSTRSFSQTSDSMSATLIVRPYPPVPMKDTTLELTLRNQNGQALLGADILFDLTMPEMKMPPNHPEATEQGDGVYQAQALFTMAGKWRIQAQISHGDARETFAFDLSTR